MKVLQINSVINSGSTGRIAEDIGRVLIENGHESYIAFGRNDAKSASHKIKTGNKLGIYFHVLLSMIFDAHGFGSYFATKRLVRKISKINPDAIILHNLHGYYLNVGVLSRFLAGYNKKVLWTFHDAWPITGHCSYFDSVECEKWKIECNHCPKSKSYPSSYVFDFSMQNFKRKKKLFGGIPNLEVITPSNWLAKVVNQSFLNKINVKVIHNGIDLSIFVKFAEKSERKMGSKRILLGVASIWDERKGLNDFVKLSSLMPNHQIVLIGLSKKQIESLPPQLIGIERTENIHELVGYYNQAFAFINPTYQDNFPTTNIEALACGTPVITYNTGGSPEAIDEQTGIVVPKGDIQGLKKAIEQLEQLEYDELSKKCRQRAEMLFDKNKRFLDYLHIIEKSVQKNDQ
jgi:glycosyltransferase involved in cell wall biosynthesis